MKASPLPFVAHLFAVCLLLSPLRAADVDNDGLDDLWQQRYTIASFTGSADPDGDGRINLVESRNFSNPHKSDSNPLGIVMIRDLNPVDGLHDPWQAQFGITAAQKWEDPDGDGRTNLEECISKSHPFVADAPFSLVGVMTPAPERPGPDSFIARVPDSAQGRRYLLEVSDTLLPGSWVTATMINNGSPYQWGTGDELSGEALTGNSPRKFFRWKIDDPDSDGDFIPDWMEMQLGTAVNNPDSDGDGDTDGYEWMEGTDAMDAADGTQAKGYEKGRNQAAVVILSYYKTITNNWYGGYAAPDSSVSWYGSVPGGQTEAYNGYYPLWQSRINNIQYPPHSAGGQIPWIDNYYGVIGNSIGNQNEANKVGYVSLVYHEARLGSTPQLTPQPWDVKRWLMRFDTKRPVEGSNWEYSNTTLQLLTVPKGGHYSDPVLLEPAVEMGQYKHSALSNPSVTSMTQGIDPKDGSEPWIMVPAESSKQVALEGGTGDGGHRWMYRFSGVRPIGLGVEDNAVRTGFGSYNWITLVAEPDAESGTIHAGVAQGEAGTPTYAENEPLMRVLVLPRKALTVVIHPISLLGPDGSVIAVPGNCPTASQFKSYLDSTLKEQANLDVTVTVLPTVPVNWDVGVQVPGSDTSGVDAATRLNQRLDLLDTPGNYLDGTGHLIYAVSDAEKDMFGKSMEEDHILTAAPPDLSKEVNVYFVAAPNGLQHTQFYPPRHPLRRGPKHMKINEDGVLGYAGLAAPGNGGLIWVYDFAYRPTIPSLGTPTHKWAILHEIVHYVAGVGHSTDDGEGGTLRRENSQPNTDNERRVMTGLSGPKRATSPSKLIKIEWERLNRKLGPLGLAN